MCVYVCVRCWPIQEKKTLKLMTAMKWDVGGIDFIHHYWQGGD